MQDFKLRKAKLSEYKRILELYLQSHFLTGLKKFNYEESDIKDYIRSKTLYVFEKKEKIIAAMFLEVYTGYVYLHSIIVDKKYRHKKIGTKIMSFLEDFCRKKKIKQIEVMVNDKNYIMQHFLKDLKYNKGYNFIYFGKEIDLKKKS